jgi:cyanophycin synthetase
MSEPHEPCYPRSTPDGDVPGPAICHEAQVIAAVAQALGIRATPIADTRAIELRHGDQRWLLHHRLAPTTTAAAVQVLERKHRLKRVLERAGVPVCRGFHLSASATEHERRRVFEGLAAPLVVKVDHGGGGRGVVLGVEGWAAFSAAVRTLLAEPEHRRTGVLVEEMFRGAGREYRILATPERVLAVAECRPACVRGDGRRSVAALVAALDEDPRRRPGESGPLSRVRVDDELVAELASRGWRLDSVPAADQQVVLRSLPNLSLGAEVFAAGAVHPSVHALAVRTVRAVPGLAFAGLDLLVDDIAAPLAVGTHVVVELNAAPRFTAVADLEPGGAQAVARELLRLAFSFKDETAP